MNRKWTFEKIQEEALKYKTRGEFQKKNKTAYNIALRRKLLDQICTHMSSDSKFGKNNPNFKWTLEDLQKEALKYESRSEFKYKSSGAYQAAWARGVLDQICNHTKYLLNYWNEKTLHLEALKYKTRGEFQKNSVGAYLTACHLGILDKICSHIIKVGGTSLAQKEIASFIKNVSLEIQEETKKIISPLELDIFIPSLNVAIEYCGLYWHSEEYKENNYHCNKMKLCNKKGIRLITIFEDEWLERQDQVKNFLLSVLNKNEIKLMARKTDLKEVPKKEAIKFLEENHIQGAPALEIAFGLYYNNELQAIITGNKHHRQGHQDIFVLNRLAFKSNVSIAGGSSKLLKALLTYAKERGYSKVISWSDNRWSEGNVYEKLGFELTEELPPDYSYVQKQKRISKQSCQKKNLIKKGAIGNTEHEMALSLGLYRIWDCGKKRWEIKL